MYPGLASAGVEKGRLKTGVGAHKQDEVGLLQPNDGGVEEVAGAQVGTATAVGEYLGREGGSGGDITWGGG